MTTEEAFYQGAHDYKRCKLTCPFNPNLSEHVNAWNVGFEAQSIYGFLDKKSIQRELSNTNYHSS